MQPAEQQQSARPVDVSLLLQMIGERDVTIAVLQKELVKMSTQLEQLTTETLALRREEELAEVAP